MRVEAAAAARYRRGMALGTRSLQRPHPWLLGAVVLLAVVVHLPTLENDFVLDDREVVIANPMVRELELGRLLVSDYWEPYVRGGLYRPLVTISFALQFALAGADPWSYHAVNVLLHGLVAGLVFLLFRCLGVQPAAATMGAALFAVHAVHVEAVSGIVGRAELLAAAGFLAALLAHARFRDAAGRGEEARAWYAAGLGAFALAVFSKENAIVLPVVIVLHDLAFPEPDIRRWRARLRAVVARGPRYAGYALVAVAYLSARWAVLGREPTQVGTDLANPLIALDPPLRVLNALVVAFRYLGLLLFPRDLVYDYSYATILPRPPDDPVVWAALAGTAAFLALLGWSARRHPPLFFALGFGATTFLPVSNVPVAIGTILGERLLYLPSVGFCLAIALAVSRLADTAARGATGRRWLLAGLAGAAVALHAARSIDRIQDWRSDATLFLHDRTVNPRSAKVQNNAGAILRDQGRLEEAAEAFARAHAIKPDYFRPLVTWGHTLVALGRTEEARERYEQAFRLGARDALLLNNLGYLLLEAGHLERGAALIARAVEEEPDSPSFLDSLGWAYFRLGRLEEAHDHVQRSLALDASGPSGERRREHLARIEQALRERGAR